MIPIDLAYPALLLAITGYGYFTPFLPESAAAFLKAHNVYSLKTMLWWMTAINAIKAACCLVALSRRPQAASTYLPEPTPNGNPPVGSAAALPAGAAVGSAAPPAGAAKGPSK